jgi:hypothetical protein
MHVEQYCLLTKVKSEKQKILQIMLCFPIKNASIGLTIAVKRGLFEAKKSSRLSLNPTENIA